METFMEKVTQFRGLFNYTNIVVRNNNICLVFRNRVHLTRLVLASEGAERPKSSPDSIELEEHTQDLWEIHEPASERLKRSATCKVWIQCSFALVWCVDERATLSLIWLLNNNMYTGGLCKHMLPGKSVTLAYCTWLTWNRKVFVLVRWYEWPSNISVILAQFFW